MCPVNVSIPAAVPFGYARFHPTQRVWVDPVYLLIYSIYWVHPHLLSSKMLGRTELWTQNKIWAGYYFNARGVYFLGYIIAGKHSLKPLNVDCIFCCSLLRVHSSKVERRFPKPQIWVRVLLRLIIFYFSLEISKLLFFARPRIPF